VPDRLGAMARKAGLLLKSVFSKKEQKR